MVQQTCFTRNLKNLFSPLKNHFNKEIEAVKLRRDELSGYTLTAKDELLLKLDEGLKKALGKEEFTPEPLTKHNTPERIMLRQLIPAMQAAFWLIENIELAGEKDYLTTGYFLIIEKYKQHGFTPSSSNPGNINAPTVLYDE